MEKCSELRKSRLEKYIERQKSRLKKYKNYAEKEDLQGVKRLESQSGVKAVTGNAKSLKTMLLHPEKYHVEQALKLGDYNVGRMEKTLTLPMYMGFMLKEVR